MKKIAPIICILSGIYWLYGVITKYPLWHQNGPGGGLFPAVAGFLLIICGTIILVRIHKDHSDTFFLNKKACLAFAATFATVFSIKFLGMAGALFLFLFCWIHFVEKQKALTSFLLSFGTSGGIWLVFSFFLHIPLPMGILG